jgi:hypothetical protein
MINDGSTTAPSKQFRIIKVNKPVLEVFLQGKSTLQKIRAEMSAF